MQVVRAPCAQNGDQLQMPPDEGRMPEDNSYPPDLAGRRAVVTGAAKGIGLAIAMGLIAAGAEVTAVDRDHDRLVDAYDGLKCTTIVEDVRRAGELAEQVLASGLVVDLIVNNVGMSRGRGFFTQRLMNDFRRARQGDVERGELPRKGAVVFVSSVHSGVVSHDPLYSMSKAAIDMLACELAAEYGRYGMRVNVLSPGWIRTSLTPESDQQQAKLARMRKAIPLGAPGYPTDATHLALLMLSEAYGGYMNGANVRLDGGLAQYTSYRVPDERA